MLFVYSATEFLSPRRASSTTIPYSLIIINPSKENLHPFPHINEFVYYYTYENSVPTTHWLAKKGYVFMDLTAGPVEYGVLNTASSGTVHEYSLPLVEAKEQKEKFEEDGQVYDEDPEE